MLLSSILRMLDQNQAQLKAAEQAKASVSQPQKRQEGSGLQKIELEIAAAAELAKPSGVNPVNPANAQASPFMEELLRAINKFDKPEKSRAIDVFE
jgi:hypothetical protein